MRTPNDCKLAEEVKEIDIILGGHDHVYEVKEVNGTYAIKSGTDFKDFSAIDLKPIEDLSSKELEQVKAENMIYKNRFIFSSQRVRIDSKWERDPELQKHIKDYEALLEK